METLPAPLASTARALSRAPLSTSVISLFAISLTQVWAARLTCPRRSCCAGLSEVRSLTLSKLCWNAICPARYGSRNFGSPPMR